MSAVSDRGALIVGAGVSGLTTAVVLAEAGIPVRVVSSLRSADTMSARAGASWGPFLSGHGALDRWSAVSREQFVDLAGDTTTGVRLMPGMEAYAGMDHPPDWATEVPDFRHCRPEEVPPGYDGAWRYTIPIIDMPRYLRYLNERLHRAGVEVELVAPIRDIKSFAGGDLVVNCAGLGARDLVGDQTVRPFRGQLTVVENTGIVEFFQDNVPGNITCVFPHRDVVVLGGISQADTDSLDVDHDQARQMVERCERIEPALRGARVLEHRVGLRPRRENIRVEADDSRDSLIHNYGHGGSGITLSWGCAREVLRIVQSAYVAT